MKSAYSFRDVECVGYVNINRIQQCKKRLHSIETLFGDRRAEVLVLLQDAAPAQKFGRLRKRGIWQFPQDVFRHDEKVWTNRRLVQLFEDAGFKNVRIDGSTARNCGLFGANAVWLLKGSGRSMSGRLPNLKRVIKASEPVFEETVDGLPNLKLIICFGRIAHFGVQQWTELKGDWVKDRKSGVVRTVNYRGRTIGVASTWHPAARVRWKKGKSDKNTIFRPKWRRYLDQTR
ncbi:MAG: hypothetical protein AB7N70_09650 [Dehalococcoidia bacterium]